MVIGACVTEITAFWGVTLCNLVDSYQYIIETCYLHLQGRRITTSLYFSILKAEAASSFEILVTL
jgi:hypothetical protein